MTAWIRGYQISQIVVLRANLVSRPALARLVQLTADTRAGLCLI